MALAVADRAKVVAHWQRLNTEGCSISKAQLRAVIDAVDDWVDANQTSFNNAIPQPQRGALSAAQKAAVLVYVVMRRQGLLDVEP